MAIPGFSAERSLFKRERAYLVSRNNESQHSRVIPQMTMQCLVEALGLYNECLAGGYNCNGELSRMIYLCKKYT